MTTELRRLPKDKYVRSLTPQWNTFNIRWDQYSKSRDSAIMFRTDRRRCVIKDRWLYVTLQLRTVGKSYPRPAFSPSSTSSKSAENNIEFTVGFSSGVGSSKFVVTQIGRMRKLGQLLMPQNLILCLFTSWLIGTHIRETFSACACIPLVFIPLRISLLVVQGPFQM